MARLLNNLLCAASLSALNASLPVMPRPFDGGDDDGDEFDLADIPMDAPQEDGDDDELDDDLGDDENDDDEPGEQAPGGEQQQEPLSREELDKRYQNLQRAFRQQRAELRNRNRGRDDLDPAPREQRQERTPAEPDTPIDPDVDPLGALKQMRETIANYQRAEDLKAQNEEAAGRQERALAAVEAKLEEYEADFKIDHPDYGLAARHFAEMRARELIQFGVGAAELPTMLRQEFAAVVARAVKSGRDPAAVVYNLAKGRGYKAKGAADPAADKGDKGKGRRAAAEPQSRAAARKPNPNLERIREGGKSTSPLGRSGGTPRELDAGTIANIDISTAAGRKAFDKLSGELIQREIGRERRSGRQRG